MNSKSDRCSSKESNVHRIRQTFNPQGVHRSRKGATKTPSITMSSRSISLSICLLWLACWSCQVNCQSDLWSTLTSSVKSASCPGECIHAITSIFCDHVLEEVSCGQQYLRCCVPNDFNYGTPVEKSPPLGYDIDSSSNFSLISMTQATVTTTSASSFPPAIASTSLSVKSTPAASPEVNVATTTVNPFTVTANYTRNLLSSSLLLTPETFNATVASSYSPSSSSPYATSASAAILPGNYTSAQDTLSSSSSPSASLAPASSSSSSSASPVTFPPPTSTSTMANGNSIKEQPLANSQDKSTAPPSSSSASVASTYGGYKQHHPSFIYGGHSHHKYQTTTVSSLQPTTINSNSKSQWTSGSVHYSTTSRPEIHPDCPGVCVKMEYARFCGNIMSNGICNSTSEACCLQSEISLKESESLTKPLINSVIKANSMAESLSSGISFPDDRTKGSSLSSSVKTTGVGTVTIGNIPGEFVQSSPSNSEPSVKQKLSSKLGSSWTTFSSSPGSGSSPITTVPATTSTSTTTTTTTTTTPSPPSTTSPESVAVATVTNNESIEDCPGTCVAPLFSLLCDETDDNKYCSRGGVCCINRDLSSQGSLTTFFSSPNTTPAPIITTTTPAPIPSCPGSCLPIFFSGAFCNRPAQLIPKTSDCMTGTICCAKGEPEKDAPSDAGDNSSGESSNNPDKENNLLYSNSPEDDSLNQLDQMPPHPPPQINRPLIKPMVPPTILFPNIPIGPGFSHIHSYNQGNHNNKNNNQPPNSPQSFLPSGLFPPKVPPHLIQHQLRPNGGIRPALSALAAFLNPTHVAPPPNMQSGPPHQQTMHPMNQLPAPEQMSPPPNRQQMPQQGPQKGQSMGPMGAQFSPNQQPQSPPQMQPQNHPQMPPPKNGPQFNPSGLLGPLLPAKPPQAIPQAPQQEYPSLSDLISSLDVLPACPGVCVTSLLKFTCFGSNTLYPGFSCQSPDEICCASLSEVQAFEKAIINNLANNNGQGVLPELPNIPQAINKHQNGQAQPVHPQVPASSVNQVVHVNPPQMPQVTIQSGVNQVQPHKQLPSMNAIHVKNPNTLIIHTTPPPPVNAITIQRPPTNLVALASSNGHIDGQQATPAPQDSMANGQIKPQSGTSTASPIVVHSSSNSSSSSDSVVKHKNVTLSLTGNDRTVAVTLTPLLNVSTPVSATGGSKSSNNPHTCGVKGIDRKETARVVGGRDALPGEYCWQVALINSANQYLCGGALIGQSWVVTAAHCVTSMVRNSEEIYIRLGDTDLTNSLKDESAVTVKVSTSYIHHNHNGQTLDNDIALLKLETPVDLSSSVCLACLPTRGSTRKPGKMCTVTGYGYVNEAGPIALKVRAAPVPIVDDQDCTAKINAVTEKVFILPASSFCAGGSPEGNDACQGDGGSPLVCESDGFYEVTGLVSWGFGCARMDVPAVYVKVSSFIGWINQIISVNNQ